MLKRLISRRKKTPTGDDDAHSSASVNTSEPSLALPEDRRLSETSSRLLPQRERPSIASDHGIIHDDFSDPGPIGLSVVYTPDNAHKTDIVFVHGLGGTSRWTWAKHRKLETFWPLTFLPLEPDICLARIMTFGYNASFQKSGSVSTSIFDFAKALLFDLKYAKGQQTEELGIGNVPLIFIVHSMGGLIVKEAYMQGQNDPEYEAIVKAITAICFLATPHRGTTLAQTLNRILDSTMVTQSKQYVADLMKNSMTIQKLNEQFRHIAPRLDIVSFYETLPTSIGIKSAKVMVLEKDSSILGYPGEVSKALDADHHGVCKYENPQDPNYVAVRNVLKSLVSKIISRNNGQKPERLGRRASLNLRNLLAIPELPTADYIFFRDKWTDKTNTWIFHQENFLHWGDSSVLDRSILWVNGGAATGKSVLTSSIINHLVERGSWCQYFFIRHDDRTKRSLSLLLRSIAFQLATSVPAMMQKIEELVDEAIDFENVDPRIIWDRVFKSIILKWEYEQPVYWIIDGLDEAQDFRAVVKTLTDIASSATPLRILFTSRRMPDIQSILERSTQSIHFATIEIEGHLEDLRRHIEEELTVPGSVEFKREIEQRIVDGAQNNFLWVRLAVERVNKCYTRPDVEKALQELPVGMEAIYDRMASSITEKATSTKRLATRILQYVTCSMRTLTVSELSAALNDETLEMLDLPHTLMGICGEFVAIDNDGNVAMVHQTAREYLLGKHSGDRPLRIDPQVAHRELLLSSLRSLLSIGLRHKLNRNQWPEFLRYAATSWSSHLRHVAVDDHDITMTLKRFLSGNSVLSWIHALALTGQLGVLIRASKDLYTFASRRRQNARLQSCSTPVEPLLDDELFESWGTDFLRVLGKFGNALRRRPECIYKSVPPFCPRSSPMYQYFGRGEAKALAVTGLSGEMWDDSLARMSLGQDSSRDIFASHIITVGSTISVLASHGDVYSFGSSDFLERKSSPIRHGERVQRMHMNSTATLLATYGYRTTKIWDVSTGKCKITVNSVESRTRPLAMLFAGNNSTLLVGTDDRRLRTLDLHAEHVEWCIKAELDEPELENHIANSASHMALSHDGTMIAVGYRRHPLSAWETDGPSHIGHCRRQDEATALRELRDLVWHPHEPVVFGVNLEGYVLRWAPYDDTIEELPAAATKLALSQDGSFFATGDGHGRIKIYLTATLTLVYQSAAQDAVFGLAFSPDSRRLYDIRGYYANAWEPSALVRLAKDFSLETESNSEMGRSTDVSVDVRGAVDSVTAVAPSPGSQLYCFGTERGLVSLGDAQKGKIADIFATKARFAIEQVSWSDCGNWLCFADASQQLTVLSVAIGPGQTLPVVTRKFVISLRGSIDGTIIRLLFDPSSTRVAVHSSSQICIVTLESGSVQKAHQQGDDPTHQIIPHPASSAHLLALGPTSIRVLDWDLVECNRQEISWPSIEQPESPDSKTDACHGYLVEKVLVSHNKKHILLQASSQMDNLRKSFFHCETALLPPETWPDDHQRDKIHLSPLEMDSPNEISVVLALLRRDRLVFLSKSFAVCLAHIQLGKSHSHSLLATRSDTASSRATSIAETSRRHLDTEQGFQELFALPGDWICKDCLTFCSVWQNARSFVCPRNGEVAVVKCALIA